MKEISQFPALGDPAGPGGNRQKKEKAVTRRKERRRPCPKQGGAYPYASRSSAAAMPRGAPFRAATLAPPALEAGDNVRR